MSLVKVAPAARETRIPITSHSAARMDASVTAADTAEDAAIAETLTRLLEEKLTRA